MKAPRVIRPSLNASQAALALIVLWVALGLIAFGLLEWRMLVRFLGWMMWVPGG